MVYYFTSNTVSPSAHIYVGKDKVENEELIKYGWEEDVWYCPACPALPHLQANKLHWPINQSVPLATCADHGCVCSRVRNLHPPTPSFPSPQTGSTSAMYRTHPLFFRDGQFHADNLSSAHIYLRLPSSSSSSSSSSPPSSSPNATTTTFTAAASQSTTASTTSQTEPYTWATIPRDLLTDLAQLTKANSIEGNKKDNVTIIYTPWSNLRKDGSMAVGQVGFRDNNKVKKILVPTRTNAIVNRLNKTRVERFPDLRAEREDRQREVRKREQAATQERRREEARVARERKEKAWQRDHAYDDLFAEEEVMRSSNQDRGEDFLDDFM